MDKQSEIMAELKTKLAAVPVFGSDIFERAVMRVLDSESHDFPQSFIVLQQGETSEVERVGTGSIREQMLVTITLVTSTKDYAAAFRQARYHIKRIFAGRDVRLKSSNGQPSAFLTETAWHPEPGRSLAAYAMPLQIGYVQNY